MSFVHHDDEAASVKPLSPWWRHTLLLVMILGFSVLSFMTVKTYDNAPPIPARVVDPQGITLFTGDDIRSGQAVFFKFALMEHGSLWGHGAYLGPDYSAEYLHRLGEISRDTLAMAIHGKPYADLDRRQAAGVAEEASQDLQQNRYEAQEGTLRCSAGETESFRIQAGEWRDYFIGPRPPPGLPVGFIRDHADLQHLTAFFAWSAWACSARRPGKDYSYTNNWPYEPLVGNRPSASAYLWSALSIITLLGGIGAILLMFGKFHYLGWKGMPDGGHEHHVQLMAWKTTPSQRVTAWFFAIVAVLFLAQGLMGGALAHYRVDPNSFFGIHLEQWLPYNLLRTWHLQLAIFWIATAWVAGGLFLAPMIGGAEPRRQRLWAAILLGALVIVVGGSLGGEFLGINDKLGGWWFWLGHQGSEYLDLGRIWQVMLAAGLILWLVLMFRALRPATRSRGQGEFASLFLYAAVAIPVFYLPALFYGPHTNFAVIDNWRFWIIHLWVEGFFELFATVLVAVIFVTLGLVSVRTATRLVYLDGILYLAGGILGTGHHWYFTGQGTLNMGVAACFSALEVVPLTLLTLDAWDFIRVKDRRCDRCDFAFTARHLWTIKFLIAVGVWNFVGAGIFGFLINLPVISYFEVGTSLTANHAHAAMFGVFGMLALAVTIFCLRSMLEDSQWRRIDGLVRIGFWGLNIGLALMVILDLFPAGVIQLWDVFTNGYWHARRLTFLMGGAFHTLEWIRMSADAIFLVVGAVPMVIAIVRGAVMASGRAAPHQSGVAQPP